MRSNVLFFVFLHIGGLLLDVYIDRDPGACPGPLSVRVCSLGASLTIIMHVLAFVPLGPSSFNMYVCGYSGYMQVFIHSSY